MKDGTTVWLPYRPSRIPGLPDRFCYDHWDGAGPLPGDPGEVRFLVAPPADGTGYLLRSVLPHMCNLEVLQLLGSGHAHLASLLDALPAGAKLATGRAGRGGTTAQLAVALLLSLCRGLDRTAVHRSPGEVRGVLRFTLVGKRVLVVGYDAVGAAVAVRLGALRCEVVLVGRTARTTPAGRVHGVAELTELLPTADAVVLCAPLTDLTHGVLGAHALALLQDGTLLVDVSQGGLVDTRAAAAAVRAGRLRIALDATGPRALPPGHPLRGLPGALVAPHEGVLADTFPGTATDFLRHQLYRYQRGEELYDVVPETTGTARGDRVA
ncbi:dehydrogenase [Streptomyces dioscori]|uniref:Dehydrogenase n=1 Tax=Streptomyces dioscori TaxID=2109333 RepID=A0A2P8Q9I7_9ACTN|nr:NAD(P)-dependent oxidoreductase [Streptomyces dioscori]PSM42910.1 dehydrogenase [Streptomyces dioscori]